MLGMGSDREVERIFAWRLHLFAARVLLGQPRGRRRVRESRSEVLQRRCRQFMAGEWQQLWEEVRYRSLNARPPREDAAIAEHATHLAGEGLYSKAAAALEQAPLSPATDATCVNSHPMGGSQPRVYHRAVDQRICKSGHTS